MGDVRKGLRTVRNVVHNYNDAQVKVREATSNDPWGPAASLMSEVAEMSYNHLAFSDIMQMLWKRMNDSGKDWRHVYKALVVLDYIIKAGSDKVAMHCKENLYFIQTLQNFQHMEENKDLGMNVREKAKQVVVLLTDDERLKNERVKAQKTRERFSYAGGAGGTGSLRDTYPSDEAFTPTSGDRPRFGSGSGFKPDNGGAAIPAEMESVRPQNLTEEEIQLQIALAMSKEEAEEEERRRNRDDMRLQLALSESQNDYQNSKPVAVSSRDELFDVFHQPGQHGSHSTPSDPWGADDFGVSNGSSSNGGSHGPSGAVDPWSSPMTSSHSHQQGRPGVPLASSPMNMPINNSAAAAAASLDPWSQLTPVPANSNLSTSPNSLSKKPGQDPAQNFLGQNSNLVNLDSLITVPRNTPPATSAFSLNPFGLSAASGPATMTSAVNNPFHQPGPPPPTINQLRNVNTNPYDPNAMLPQPLLPVSGGPQAPQGRFVSPGQQSNSNNNYNPFL